MNKIKALLRDTDNITMIIAFIALLFWFLIECLQVSLLPSSEELMKKRFEILLVFLTLQIPFLIFIFETVARTTFSRKVIFDVLEIKKIFIILLLVVIANIFMPWLMWLLMVIAISISLNFLSFRVAYELTTGSLFYHRAIEEYLHKIVKRVFKNFQTDKSSKDTNEIHHIEAVIDILDDIDKGLYENSNSLHTRRYEELINWLQVISTYVDDQLVDDRKIDRMLIEEIKHNFIAPAPSTNKQRAMIHATLKIYQKHLKSTWLKNEDQFIILFSKLEDKLYTQITPTDQGVKAVNLAHAIRQDILLKRCIELYCTTRAENLEAKRKSLPLGLFDDFNLHIFKSFTYATSNNIPDNLKSTYRNLFIYSSLPTIHDLIITSMLYSNGDIFKQMLKHLLHFINSQEDKIDQFEEIDGMNHMEHAKYNLLSIYQWVKDSKQIERSTYGYNVIQPYILLKMRTILSEVINGWDAKDLTMLFIKCSTHTAYMRDIANTYYTEEGLRHYIFDNNKDNKETFLNLWVELISNKFKGIELDMRTESYADKDTLSTTHFFQDLQFFIESRDNMATKLDSSKSNEKRLKKLIKKLSQLSNVGTSDLINPE